MKDFATPDLSGVDGSLHDGEVVSVQDGVHVGNLPPERTGQRRHASESLFTCSLGYSLQQSVVHLPAKLLLHDVSRVPAETNPHQKV